MDVAGAEKITASFPIARFRYEGIWRPEPAVLDRLATLGPAAGVEIDLESDTAGVISGPGLLWITGTTAADAEAIDLDILAESAKNGRRLLFESLNPDFVAALTAKFAKAEWTVSPSPPGCPTGTAAISPPGAVGGLLITAEISRPVLGRPAKAGITIGDVLGLLQVAVKLGDQG